MHKVTYTEYIRFKVAFKALSNRRMENLSTSIYSKVIPENMSKKLVKRFEKVIDDLTEEARKRRSNLEKRKGRSKGSAHIDKRNLPKKYRSKLLDLDEEDLQELVREVSEHLDGYSHDPSHELLDELLSESFNTPWRIKRKFIDVLKSTIKELIESSDYKDCITLKALEEVRTTFNLDQIDSDITFLAYLIEDDDVLEEYYREVRVPSSISRFCTESSVIFGHDKKVLRDRLSRTNKLLNSKVIEINRSDISISDYIAKFLNNPKENTLLEYFVSDVDLSSELTLEDFVIEKDSIGIIQSLLKGSKKPILFHGPPGCGKTEFAKVLLNQLKMKTYFMTQKDEDGDENLNFRKTALTALKVRNTESKNAVVVDEADTLLKTKQVWTFFNFRDDSKAWVNDYLDECSCPMIWIVNDISQIDESTLRRFSYTLKFRRHGAKERLRFIKRNLEVNDIKLNLGESELKEIAGKYDLNVGDIAKAIEDLAVIQEGLNEEEFLESFEKILLNKTKTYNKKINTNKVPSNYNVNAINTSFSTKEIVENIDQFYEQNSFVKNMNLLFHGVPGTGKTEFAQYIADTLNKEIIIKKGSDLLSPWVGMTEKYISEAFEEAESKDAILFIDEADTFFSSRESATKSWERSQTNEFLNGMERFSGVLICASNFSDNFDIAAMRRFSMKIKFDYLTEGGNVLMAKTWFGQLLECQLEENHLGELMGLKNLTPGDFKAVAYKYAFNKGIDPDVLIDELRNEVLYKKIKKGISL